MSGVAERGRDGDGRLKRRQARAAFAGRQCLSEYLPRLNGCLWERLIVLRSTATGKVASDVWGMMCGCVWQGACATFAATKRALSPTAVTDRSMRRH